MKGIKLCGECGNYDYKKHGCRIGCIDDSNAQASFYGDCPLPDVAPKSEVDLYRKQVDELEDELASTYEKLENAKTEVAREIFEEIDKTVFADMDFFKNLKKKYTGE